MAVHVNMNGFHRLITHTYIKCNAFILKLAPLSLYLVNTENKDSERYTSYLMLCLFLPLQTKVNGYVISSNIKSGIFFPRDVV